MVAIAQAGLLGFGPQFALGSTPSLWQYHKATDIDLSAMDDQRLGPPEVGGRPLPTIPYKGGITVGGGFTINPRLEGSLGWLLYGALGKKAAAVAGLVQTGIVIETLITTGSSGTDTIASTTVLVNEGTPSKVVVRLRVPDDVTTYTPTVTVTGTAVGDGAQTETFNMTTGPTTGSGQRMVGIKSFETIVGGKVFKTVTSVALAKAPVGSICYISVGYEDSVLKSHLFTIDTTDPAMVKWMGFRKLVPRGSDTSLPYGEQYQDCKVMTYGMTLPNDGLINARVDTLGRLFTMADDPFNASAGVWAHGIPSTEDYQSIPIGCNVAGYIRIPMFSSDELPVINATTIFSNTPLDLRQLRVYGSPYLKDVAVVGRAFTFDMTVMWESPELYKAILGNSKVATEWSAQPFTSRMDVYAQAPGLATGANAPYGIHVEATKVMMAIQGGIRLAGNQSVLMRLTGTALDVSGDYVQITLDNLKSDADYLWPTS